MQKPEREQAKKERMGDKGDEGRWGSGDLCKDFGVSWWAIGLLASARASFALPDFGHVVGNALTVLAFSGDIATLWFGAVVVLRHL